MRCEICGKEAPYFTETYDPMEGKVRTIYLCEEHQETMYMRIVDAMLYLMESEHYTEYKKGILKVPEVTDADKEAIRKAMEANDTAMPIIQVHPMKNTIRDIGRVLVWLYNNGILMNGRDEHIEELLRNITKEGEE